LGIKFEEKEEAQKKKPRRGRDKIDVSLTLVPYYVILSFISDSRKLQLQFD
jgi:hypothetical protein